MKRRTISIPPPTSTKEVSGPDGSTIDLGNDCHYKTLNVTELTTLADPCMYCGDKITPGDRVFFKPSTRQTLHYECSSQELFSILKDS